MKKHRFTQMAAVFGVVCALTMLTMTGAFAQAFPPGPPLPGGTLDPTTITKYVSPLVVPPAMPKKKMIVQAGKTIDYYEIAMRQFQQQILPAPLPKSTVWGYGAVGKLNTFHSPSYTIEAQVNRPVRVKWVNDLKDAAGNYLPHLLPVDQTLSWANPAMECADGSAMTDCRGSSQFPYTGPVPMVTHLHGGHIDPESDGFPQGWYLPAAKNIPAGYGTQGSMFEQMAGVPVRDGEAVYQYRNDQRATTLWYHDHTMGMTRTNVYAGPAGFYLLRGGPGDVPAWKLPGGKYEVPIAIQDRSFNSDGSLFYPDSRVFFDGFTGPYINDPLGVMSDISPIWNPEFFGNTMMVNGRTWPFFNVEPRRYRLRLLNGTDSRFLILKLVKDSPTGTVTVPFWQIGSDGGFLPQPVQLDQLLIGPAERADVIVDFTGIPNGTAVYMVNSGPDEPFGGGVAGVDFPPSNLETTGQVMKFNVGILKSFDYTVPPSQTARLALPAIPPLPAVTATRQVSLNEVASELVCVDVNNVAVDCADPTSIGFHAPRDADLGIVTVNPDGTLTGVPMAFMDMVTENPALNSTEVWEIFNFTEDAHPIHIHLVQFEVVNRQGLIIDPVTMAGSLDPLTITPPEAWETGRKDTVIVYPGSMTRVKAKFDIPGLYVWHCHILSHEDNEMMRPYFVESPVVP